MCVELAVIQEENVVFDHVEFDFAGTICPGLPMPLEKKRALLLISDNNISKKKDANVHVKLTYFYFLEKDRKLIR